GGLVLRSVGPKVPSAFHLAMTVDVLRRAGIQVEEFAAGGAPADREHPAVEWHVHPGTPQLGTVVLEPDLSNASPFLAAAMVTGGTVEIPRWPAHTTQPGAQIVDIFTAMGARGFVFIGHAPRPLQSTSSWSFLPDPWAKRGMVFPVVAIFSTRSPGMR
ncbi:3-phosphoshikimate 1-carboxyvinyltransferase, partial [Actinotignum timonense]|nr:3-phosphoshikimate 1-carboxyvinyltransferase [Actinotignum timonense]